MPRLGAVARIAALVLLLPVSSWADPIPIRSEPVALHTENREIVRTGALRYRGGLALRSTDRRFGGFSALAVSPDGRALTAVSDRGYWLAATLSYDSRGDLVAISDGEIGELLDPDGHPVANTAFNDAEAITVKDDRYIVAFEHRHRLWSYERASGLAGRPRAYPAPPGLERAPANEAMEALTTLRDGSLLILTENYASAPGEVMGWIQQGPDWRRLSYALTGLFKPVGATTLPSGDVVVLERRFTFAGGAASRFVRLAKERIRAGALLDGVELGRLERPMIVENFEGIETWQRADGAQLLLVISDDNYNALQRTLLLMFEIEN